MIINTSRIEHVLTNKAIPAYMLEAETGMSRMTIGKIRKGEAKVENITLKNIMAIQKWIDSGSYTFSYDYSDLLSEVLADKAEGLFDEYMYIVRGDWNEVLECAPIVDYYYSLDEVENEDEVVQKMPVDQVINEMKKFNQIL
mgnify:FL=1